MAKANIVMLVMEDASCSSWVLTDLGVVLLRPVHRCGQPVRVLEPRRDVPLGDLTAFELLRTLEVDGWDHRVYVAGRKEFRVDVRTPYAAGNAKVFWLRQGVAALSRWYLLALATVAEHGQPLPRLKSDAAYKYICAGKVYAKPEKRGLRDDMFQFVAHDGDGVVERVPRAGERRGRVGQRRAGRVLVPVEKVAGPAAEDSFRESCEGLSHESNSEAGAASDLSFSSGEELGIRVLDQGQDHQVAGEAWPPQKI